jgi:hypothetical protein
MIQECDFNVLKSFKAIPYHDEDDSARIKGCRLLMLLKGIVNITQLPMINLLEQNLNNIYTL